jgi:diguanylate cyclase (GGDEF)-like protein/PAS domain S-box-containing protein
LKARRGFPHIGIMNPQNLPFDSYLVTLVAGALISIGVLVAAWRRRDAPGAVPLFVFTAASAWWMVCYALFLVAAPASDRMVWFKLMYAAIVLIPPGFLAFALQYTGRGHWVSLRLVGLLAIEPLLVNLLAWTDPYHGLLFNGWQGPEGGWFAGGAGFWIHTIYSYMLLGLSTTLLIQGFVRAPTIYRRQAGMMLFGAVVPLLGNALTIFQLSPFPRHDLTPLGLAISTAVIGVALFWRGLLDLMPVARNAVVEYMHDGVVVFDRHHRVIDLNPAARAILNIGDADVLGKPARVALAAWSGYSSACLQSDDFHDEVSIGKDRYIDLSIFRLGDQRGGLGGRLAVMRDITPLKQASVALQEANDRQRRQLEEIEAMQILLKEQTIRDPLTGLYNRRFMEETLARDLGQAERTESPVSVVIIDLDFFKRINDTHGHGVGDLVLEAMGSMLRASCRSGDAACRYGGEEFVVILPGASLTAAVQRVDQWRREFMALRVPCNDTELSCTFSAGVATYPVHGLDIPALLKVADNALYAAKQNGRNRVCPLAEDAGQSAPIIQLSKGI